MLCVVFQFKHFIADYPLQGSYMLGKFKYKDWVKPLAAHCAVHAVFTTAIALCFVSVKVALLCAALDFTIHFIMDRVKASPSLLGRYKALSAYEMIGVLNEKAHDKKLGVYTPRLDEQLKHNTYFWWALGVDQMVHHLTDLLVIAILVTA